VNDPVVVLGLHIAADVLWVACVAADGELMNAEPDRLQLKGGGQQEEFALAELEESVESVLQRFDPDSVALLRSGTSKRQPAPTRTQRRAWIEASVMIACARAAKDLAWITHERIKTVIGLRPTAEEFQVRVADRLGTDPPPRWAERAPAYAAGVVVLKDPR
jgi:hypothetical protein